MNTRQQPSIDASVCRVALTGRGTKRKMNHSQHGPQTAMRSALPRRNDTSRHHNNIGRHKRQPMKENTTHDLEKLLLEEPKDIVISLTQDTKRLQNMLKDTGKTTQDLFLLLQVLGKASRCTFAPQNQIHLLNTIIESRLFTFISRELSTIYIYVMRGIFDNKSEAMIRHILTLLKAILNIMPTKFLEIASAVDLLNVIAKSTSTSESGVVIDPVVIQEIHALQEDRSQVMADVRTGQTQPESEQLSEDHQSWHPPENFRSISVFPTSSDIRANVEPFLRPNIAIGPFRDTEHYLDVHFRLLREDFIQPLRKGIQEYLSQQSHPRKKHSRLTDIRVYEEVFILSPMCRDFDGICHMVQFHNGCLKRIRWKSSKRLIYGSLVCLSKDNFNTAHFATVAHREPKQLESGFLALKFHSLEDVIYELPDQPYKMVESNAYFESYRYVLEGLQDLNTNSLPFREYLVECEKEVRIPAYINSEDVTYKLCNDNVTKSRSISAPVLDTSSWPTSRELGLDESQLQALKTALTKELAIIQGPPGTGKTYIGLEIVKILLDNHKVWSGTMNPPAPSPILIVCYTNHALDQFLEGINKFQGTEIVRVGGRSKSEALEKSLISEKRKKGGVVGRLILRELKEYQERILTWTEKHRFNPSCMIYCQNLCVPQQHRHSLLTVKPGKSRWQLNDEQSILDYWLMEKIRDATNSKQMHMEYPNSDSTKLAAAIENDDDEDDNRILVEFETDFLADQRYLEGDWTQDLTMGQQHTDTNDSTYKFVERQRRNNDYKQYNRGKQCSSKRHIDILIQTTTSMEEEKAIRIKDVWALGLEERWQLCRYWYNKWYINKSSELNKMLYKFEELALRRREFRTEEDLRILKAAQIIGMTTTGAAKYRSILQHIRPKIVIVEEAAEVLESHIVTTLSSGCQHLILIGDHQQLRPNPIVYKLAKIYNLEISLFERLVRNNLHHEQLSLQHRMRPEIAELMKHFYTNLANHDSVKDYENIRGVNQNIFFIKHDKEEEFMEETKSRSNSHEAEFLIALCHYFLQQGYNPSQITILTMYTAQLLEFRKLMKQHDYHNVRVCPVDNFQGEENCIVLLSLVRSNTTGKIGFLSTANRVCVALSRARMGFYCIGNFKLLAAESELWKIIVSDLETTGNIGSSLQLQCGNHPIQRINVTCGKDFEAVPDGGCHLPCEFRKDCGHVCKRHCHPDDHEHKNQQCKEPCPRKCPNGHGCHYYCFQECGDCKVKVQKMIPTCKHTQILPCYVDVFNDCMVPVEKTIPDCQHTQLVPCHLNQKKFKCKEQCSKTLPCGHACTLTCSETCSKECNTIVEKIVPSCGHMQDMKCCQDPQEFDCKIPCPLSLACGHKCPKLCSMECPTKCEIRVLHDRSCMHEKYRPCWEKTCTMECQQVLSCSHKCQGCCGECTANGLHQVCREICKEMLPCGHKCNGYCGECTTNESHRVCRRMCKEMLPCNHRCEGFCDECKRQASHPLCRMKCMNRLSCGHMCGGYCGKCTENGSHPDCRSDCPKRLSCGHLCQQLCHELCSTVCVEMVTRQLECGHVVHMKCCDKIICPFQCDIILNCGHRCTSCCGICKAVGSHARCTNQCGVLLICGHTSFESCDKVPFKCSASHTYTCEHKRNKEQCIRRCSWSCKHYKCTKQCSELCDRPACDHPCRLTLRCGHRCAGLCGESCPDACWKCNPNVLQTAAAFFGKINRKNIHFIQLNCGHIFEVTDLDSWMSGRLSAGSNCPVPVGIKVCPRCHKAINNKRYNNIIWQNREDIKKVKDILNGYTEGFFIEAARKQVHQLMVSVVPTRYQKELKIRLHSASTLQKICLIEQNIMQYRQLAIAQLQVAKVLPLLPRVTNKDNDTLYTKYEYHLRDMEEVVNSLLTKILKAKSSIVTLDSQEHTRDPNCMNTVFNPDNHIHDLLWKSSIFYADVLLTERELHRDFMESKSPFLNYKTCDNLQHRLTELWDNTGLDTFARSTVLTHLKQRHHELLGALYIPSRMNCTSTDQYKSLVMGDWYKCSEGHFLFNPCRQTSVEDASTLPISKCPKCTQEAEPRDTGGSMVDPEYEPQTKHQTTIQNRVYLLGDLKNDSSASTSNQSWGHAPSTSTRTRSDPHFWSPTARRLTSEQPSPRSFMKRPDSSPGRPSKRRRIYY